MVFVQPMATLADVFQEFNRLKADGLVRDYAIAGATAMLFYDRPSATYDVDVFILLPAQDSPLVSLTPIYNWARARGFSEQVEHIFVHGVPVQFLPAHNALAEEGVAAARTFEYDGVPVRVLSPEHLAALAFQVGGASRRERGWLLLEAGAADRDQLRKLLAAHGISTDIDHER